MSYFLGQSLSQRSADQGSPDPLRIRFWAALRYLTLVVAVLVAALGFERSAGGAALLGVGLALALSGLLNVLLLPADERKANIDNALLGVGALVAAIGIYLLTTAS